MQNVLSVNASNKIKGFSQDVLCFSPHDLVHRDKELLKNTHIMTERSTLFMAAMFNDNSTHTQKKKLCYNSHKILYHNGWDNNECDFL